MVIRRSPAGPSMNTLNHRLLSTHGTMVTEPMESSNMQVNVHHRPEAKRFEALVDGHLSVAEYHVTDGVMHMTHTGVPSALQGRGIAAALVAEALAHARAQGLKVNPVCSYVRVYMQRHPDTLDLMG